MGERRGCSWTAERIGGFFGTNLRDYWGFGAKKGENFRHMHRDMAW